MANADWVGCGDRIVRRGRVQLCEPGGAGAAGPPSAGDLVVGERGAGSAVGRVRQALRVGGRDSITLEKLLRQIFYSGRLTFEQHADGKSVTCSYHKGGNRSGITWPESETLAYAAEYSHDGWGRMTQVRETTNGTRTLAT